MKIGHYILVALLGLSLFGVAQAFQGEMMAGTGPLGLERGGGDDDGSGGDGAGPSGTRGGGGGGGGGGGTRGTGI